MYTAGVTGGGAYLIYGRTTTTPLTLDSLEVTDGFRISGSSATAGLGEGRTVTAGGDINGDGFADLVITTYNGETVGSITGAGIVRVVFGGVDKLESMTFQSANGDAIGTTGVDTLTGTSGNNQLVAGDGNDTLIGNGGADVLYGGRGDDTIVVNADNVAKMSLSGTSQAIERIDGGSGIDTFKLDGAGITLDLSNVSGPAIQNIEKIDLTGSGDNTLKLTLQDMLQSFDNSNVFNSSNTTSGLAAKVTKNQLMIDGDAGDKVVLSDIANWTAAGTNVVANGHTYVAYNHNTSAEQLLIDQTITVSAS
jgi:Ca2+-binding RTX toxin-like protein